MKNFFEIFETRFLPRDFDSYPLGENVPETASGDHLQGNNSRAFRAVCHHQPGLVNRAFNPTAKNFLSIEFVAEKSDKRSPTFANSSVMYLG